MKKNIYLVQFNNLYGNAIILPYSVAVVWSYANKYKIIRDNYRLQDVVCVREDTNKIVNSIKNTPDIIGFSVYVWNYEISIELARKIKIKYPNCLIIFGGPQIPDCPDKDFLSKNDCVDIFVHGAGEIILKKLLIERLNNANYHLIKGVSLNTNIYINKTSLKICNNIDNAEQVANLNMGDRVTDLDLIPSPYLEGVFDKLMRSYSDYEWQPVWETNRGCPYSCTFCEWGSNYATKIRTFGESRLSQEINWFSQRKIKFIFGADANFGILKRDYKIADMLVKQKEVTGFPVKFRVAYAKNSNEQVFKIAELFHASEMDKGITLSVQTMNSETLKVIKRKNLEVGELSKFVQLYKRQSIPTYTDVIMGLPGESYSSFICGVDKLLDAGMHDSLQIYNCTLLPNAPMNKTSYKKKWKIQAVKVPVFLNHSAPKKEDVVEYENIVVGHKLLTQSDWINEVIFSWVVQTFHSLNLTQVIAMFLHNIYGVRYLDFYSSMLNLFLDSKGSIGNREYTNVRNKINSVLYRSGDWGTFIDEYGPINWSLEEATYLRVLDDLPGFFNEIEILLKKISVEYDIDMDEELLSDLIKYQYAIIVKYLDYNNMDLKLKYNIHSVYINWICTGISGEGDLKKGSFVVSVDNKYKCLNKKEHAKKIIWWGRKGGLFVHDNINEYELCN